ncbi:hypothetical protein PG994_009127 [Apiospora phragmitis]|uniref:Uncharacterized protein n=1 Tax=Apiospora phragmitis TaxID=2905665 RepID=A0ABR1UIE2_9PEZI
MANIPSFGPVVLEPPSTDDDTQQIVEKSRSVRADLRLLQDPALTPHFPYSWGFTIYRAVPGRDQDARFAEGVRRLNEWMRWAIRKRRYTDEDTDTWFYYPELMPKPDEHDAWDDVAARLWNEVVEDYPNADQIGTTELGQEDFTPAGEAFMSWVDQLEGVDASRRNSRYDFCLVIDEKALEALEQLPAETPPLMAPELGPKPAQIRFENYNEDLEAHLKLQAAQRDATEAKIQADPDQKRANEVLKDIWVWILDRETIPTTMAVEQYKNGENLEFPPWARIQLCYLYHAWFGRAQRHVPAEWSLHIHEDRNQGDKIRWWVSSGARAWNELMRRRRAQRAAAVSS